ncbi:hypothetical protein B0H16DRAFT_39643 [Mycena metata]|uniref:Uncharacterized protein n=1 Tax=Mycena metata TaxID=1033252 RepID=A0AAD7KLQ3_9AGAR|nr:hypothetical protein B0H16DRAFT_39643 [Mycena metata]
MCEIFPDLRDVSENSWKVEELLDDPVVQSYLGHTKIFVAKDNVNFQKELEQFLSSTLGGSDTRAFWPLVKIVKITGPFDVLVNGSIFVDLPGYGDLNPVRNRMAADYLQHAQGVCLVAPISRAKDDTGVYAQLKKNLSQTIIDGRIRDKSIIIALTGNDNAIGDNEITLKPANQATVEQLKKEALEYNQEWNALRVKMQKKEKSKAKRAAAAITQLKEQMNEILRKKTLKTKEMDRIMAVERSELVSASLQDTYFQLYRDLSPATTDIPTIPIFCVGSQDYMRIQQIDVHASSIFDVAEETGIPKLQSYFESQGEHRNLSDAIRVVSHACEFFPRISSIQFSSSPMGNQATVQTMIDNSHERCKLRLDELIIGIEKVYHDLLVAVKAAACDAEGKSASIFERHNTKKWNQYRTMMRQEGLYQNYNLNADLTKDILTRCRRHWMQAVNNQIPIHIKDFRDAIRKDLADTVKPIVKHSLRKGLARTIELFADDIQSQSIAKTQEAQRLGNRFERVITGLLKSHYARVSAEKGNGMYKRMKRR